jgi:Fe-S cluster assembly protein SufD
MGGRRFKVIEDSSGIPFLDGYAEAANYKLPEWALRFKRRGVEEYKAAFESESGGINPKILRFMTENRFARPSAPQPPPGLDVLSELGMFRARAHTIVFVDGMYEPEASFEEELPFSVYTDSLFNTLVDDPDYLDGRLSERGGLFERLNSAYLTGGVVIRVADGERLELPIHVVNIVTGRAGNMFINPRGYVEIGKNASAKVIESHAYMPGARHFHNRVFDMRAGEGAHLENCVYFHGIEDMCAIESVHAEAAAGASFELYYFLGGAGLADIGADIRLGEGAKASVGAAADASRGMDVACRVEIFHEGAGSKSRTLLAAAASDEARVRFETSLECANEARGAEAEQNSKIILFSPGAAGRIEPAQHIPGEGVKAVHGAAIGGVDRDALFYLESRGIGRAEAAGLLRKSLLAATFAETGDGEIRGEFENLIWNL